MSALCQPAAPLAGAASPLRHCRRRTPAHAPAALPMYQLITSPPRGCAAAARLCCAQTPRRRAVPLVLVLPSPCLSVFSPPPSSLSLPLVLCAAPPWPCCTRITQTDPTYPMLTDSATRSADHIAPACWLHCDTLSRQWLAFGSVWKGLLRDMRGRAGRNGPRIRSGACACGEARRHRVAASAQPSRPVLALLAAATLQAFGCMPLTHPTCLVRFSNRRVGPAARVRPVRPASRAGTPCTASCSPPEVVEICDRCLTEQRLTLDGVGVWSAAGGAERSCRAERHRGHVKGLDRDAAPASRCRIVCYNKLT